MLYNNVFDKYIFSPGKAADCGFELRDGVYTAKRELSESGFYAVFNITGSSFEANVFEEPDGDEYLPFNSNSDGGYVSAVRANVDNIKDEILRECFIPADIKGALLDYVREKYGTEPEAPWGPLREYHTLNTAKKHKWYGLFMLIPYRYLGIDKEGKINVLNLKAKPEDIPPLIDNVRYFPSYHMNKKYWISILLDREADTEHIKRLLDNSYSIVEGK